MTCAHWHCRPSPRFSSPYRRFARMLGRPVLSSPMAHALRRAGHALQQQPLGTQSLRRAATTATFWQTHRAGTRLAAATAAAGAAAVAVAVGAGSAAAPTAGCASGAWNFETVADPPSFMNKKRCPFPPPHHTHSPYFSLV